MTYIITLFLIIILIIIKFYFIYEFFFNYNTKRIIKIEASQSEISIIKEIVNNNKNEFYIRNIDIEYVNKPNFKAELYGYDGNLKKTIYRKEEINDFIKEIDNMPMGYEEKKNRDNFYTRKQLLNMCNLPDIPETSHCFSDSTHHTCCNLGPKAREYADNSGNPIGTASVNALGRIPKNDELVPWCTCTGSKVCSYYKNKFNDGTDIKFIGNTNTLNEDDGINKLNISRHKTPGIL
jgi:hypothetical protein